MISFHTPPATRDRSTLVAMPATMQLDPLYFRTFLYTIGFWCWHNDRNFARKSKMMSTSRTIDFRYAPRSVWTNLCRPDDSFKTLVDENGHLLYDYRNNTILDEQGNTLTDYYYGHFERILAFQLQNDRAPTSIRQSTPSARIPVVQTVVEYPEATLELLAFAHQHGEGKRTDIVLWTIHSKTGPYMTNFRLQAQGFGVMSLRKTVAGGTLFEARLGEAPKVALVSTAPMSGCAATDYGPTSAYATDRAMVDSTHPLRGAIMIPLNHQEVGQYTHDWALAALEAECEFWTRYPLMPLRLEVPDDAVMDMITSCARNILQAREIHDHVSEFQVGPAVYRGLWIVDGHFLLEAAQYLGHAAEAFHGLDALLKRARPDGAIRVSTSHLKETGIALFTFVRQCELMGDTGKLKELWPTIRKAVGYIEHLRELSKKNGPDAPEYGLMPPALGDGGLGGSRPEYTTALWTLAGLKAIAAAAHRIGFQEDAARFQADYDSLLHDFREHAARDMRELPDGTAYLPMAMPDGGSEYIWRTSDPRPPKAGIPAHPWDRINPATATWALAHAIYPGEVFDAADPIINNLCHLLDLMDNDEGIPGETGWEPYQSIWNYSASFYAHVWLYAGVPDKAIDYLYAFANHASSTRVWREEQSFRDFHQGYWVGDMPHNWASAEFIRLVRHLLVLEKGQQLDLLPGLPSEWIVPGKAIILERTPTRFGPITFKVYFNQPGQAAITFERDENWPIQPQACILHVQSLRAGGIEDLTLNGKKVSMADPTITI